MLLTELEPEFCVATGNGSFRRVPTFAEAQGILFLCPSCFSRNDGKGVHSVLVWFRDKGVPPEMFPAPRWVATGTSLEDLTISPSINLVTPDQPNEWHGWIINGNVT